MERVCRCLLRDDAARRPLYEVIADYVATLPEEAKAAERTYQARLAICAACPRLTNGTCALCGCYVEARAAKKGMACPDTPARWDRE